MEVKHTPLPWKAEEGAARGAWIMGADECWSALACGDDDRTAIANTGFIVRACNSHYDLLVALKDCRNAMYADNPADGWAEIISAADAAIAKAEGRS